MKRTGTDYLGLVDVGIIIHDRVVTGILYGWAAAGRIENSIPVSSSSVKSLYRSKESG